MKRYWLAALGIVAVACGLVTGSASAQGPPVPPGVQYHPDIYRLPQTPPPQAGVPNGVPPVAPAAPEFVIPDVDRVLSPPPCPPKPKKIWSGGVELGANGTDGNSQTFDFRFGFDAKRKTECHILSLDVDYIKKSSNGKDTANRSYLDWKYERLFQESPWTAIAHGTEDYDDFKAYELRSTVDLALGYRLVDEEDTSLTVRAGAGAAHEYGGPDEGWSPQAVYGLEYDHKINDRHKFSGDIEYTPQFEDFEDYFVSSRASWEMVIDAEMNISLKLSVRNRYDSMPGGADPNDLDYAAVLLWSF